MNFRGAPLDMVLNHLSEAAGFIIVLETEVRGRVDAWSNQPVTSDEAVELLSTVLAKNGCALLRNGRTLTIVSRDEALKRDIPVKSGNDPERIPKNDEIVTQIIPVRYISAVPLVRDLQALLPPQATLTANEGGNALVITDTQAHIRRMAEIIRALDTAIASVSAVRVFPLRYADAKTLATVISELFPADTGRSGQGGQQGRFMNFFRGGPGGQGGPVGMAGGMQGGSSGAGGGRAPTQRIIATADDRSNSLIVSAPEEQMPVIEDIVQRMDTNVEDVTELRVFRLKYADPEETASMLTELFPDTTSSQNNRRGMIQFGGPGGGFGGMGMRSGTDTSGRLQRSVIVSASRELLEQITPMIAQLDADPAKNQKVFVFPVENSDPAAMEDILRGLFEGQNSRNRNTSTRSSNRQVGNQLNTRATQNQNQRSGTSGFSGSRSSSFGSSGNR
jgi:type II secretory pathway component GspD/PulD (secretin)